jgi:hypothetical protein
MAAATRGTTADQGELADGSRAELVLAVAGWKPDGIGSGERQHPVQSPSRGAASQAIAELLVRIEAALAAEQWRDAAGAARVQFNLNGCVEGLNSITVTMTATTLDVTLERVHGAIPVDLAAAAESLAQSLHQRFGRRVVRVLENFCASDSAASDHDGGLQAFSRLLGPQATDT